MSKILDSNNFPRLIYSFEFPNNSVYIGLTYNSSKRKSKHFSDSKSQVYKEIEKTKLMPSYLELTPYLDKNIASKKEIEFIENYKSNGWNVLNKIKGGGLGGNNKIWNKLNCLSAAKSCTYISEFIKKYCGAYEAALKHGWLKMCTKHMNRPIKISKYSFKDCLRMANSCKTRTEFQDKFSGAYKVAVKNNWLNIICKSMIVKKMPNKFWSKQRCQKLAKKYETRRQFQINNKGAYNAAYKNNWLIDICVHMTKKQ